MRNYTPEELRIALAKAPAPLRDFAVSPTLMQIYDGIAKKHALLPGQMVAISRVTHLSLLGLERESALETNLHQALPLLSHTLTTELVADITTRVLKEGRRRVDENILEPSPFSALPNTEPDPGTVEYDRTNNLDDESPEKKALMEKERAEQEADRKAFEEKRQKEKETLRNRPPAEEEEVPYDFEGLEGEEDDDTPVQSSYEKELEEIEKEFAAKEAELAKTAPPETQGPPKIVLPRPPETSKTVPPAGPVISESKLAAPTVSVQTEVAVTPEPPPEPTVTPLAPEPPQVVASPASTSKTQPTDPYRESIE